MPRRKTHEEYLEELFEKEIDCEPIERYVDSMTKILHRCIEGHEWAVIPNSILRGSGCPECAGLKKRTHEEYLKELFKRKIEFEPIEPYVNSCTGILHRCSEGHEWKARPLNILEGTGCPECSYKSRVKTHEEYLEELFEKEIDFEPIEPYVDSMTKILHRCIEGHEWKIRPGQILIGGGCLKCSVKRKKTSKEYLEELFRKEIDFEPIEPYIDNKTKILHRCIEGHEWKVRPGQILKGNGCPECAKSGFRPEKPAILYYLKVDEYYKVGITNYTVEKRFPSPKDREKITVLFEKHYERGQDARDQEQAILKEFADYRINIPGLLTGGGNTELFTEDVLQLDKKGP